MAVQKLYKTKPLDCWDRAKELRLNHYRDVWEAKEKGKLLVTGGEYSFPPLLAGLGDFEFLGGEPYGASLAASDPAFVVKCHETTASKGYPENLCSYMRIYWGTMFLDETSPKTFPFFGKFIKPDFCFPWAMCESQGKWYQTVAEHFKIPTYVICTPLRPHDNDRERRESHVQALVTQFEDAIEWLQKITKRGYDDEKLVDAVTNEIDATALWAKVCELNKAIPAPLDMKSMYSLYVINGLIRYRKEAPEFFQTLYDEVKDRVANRIAALATEKYRYLHDPEPVWHYLKMFRFLEQYGAVCVASLYSFTVGTAFERGENGSWVPAKTMKERGTTLKTRGEALRALAESYIDRPGVMAWYPANKVIDTVKIAQDWHCNGAILSLNRGCTLTGGQLEVRLALQEAGIPTMLYEANMADPREFDEKGFLRRIEVFMDTQGLKKLGD
ncbi:MAG: 2-hydroxyacyl-CoA dehydratase [Chloroflexi bacterium]|nr:2-hydroxyacyl-CoA dehydratase [Chloroflexota bacterium]